MLLESIILKNFRQYYQEQKIDFSTSSSRNVTVIHGENGAGKTALLNAFSWCLYGKMDLPNSNNIINEHAIEQLSENEETECSVTLKFWDNDKKYTLVRKIKAVKQNNEIIYYEPEVKLSYKIDGLYEEIENPSVEINRILPENLRTYFFFDGERIDNLSKEESSEDIKNAIKNIMGLEILERSIHHTESARKRFLNELKKFGDPKTVDLIERIQQLEEEREYLEQEKQVNLKNLKAIDHQIKEIELTLKKIEGAKQLQEQRDRKNEELIQIREQINKVRKDLQEYMSKYGHLAFAYSAVKKSEEILFDQTKSSINIITGITKGFIDELLEKKRCICGAHLLEGSGSYENIKNIRESIAPQSLDNAISNFKGDLKIVKHMRKSLFDKLRDLKAKELVLLQKEKRLMEEIEEIGFQLTKKDSEEIVGLETKRQQLLQQKSNIDREIGKLEGEIDRVIKEIREKELERSKLDIMAAKAQLTQKRIDVCQELIHIMKEIYSVREKNVRHKLQDRISSIFSQFLRKGYKVRLLDSYELQVVNQNNNIVALSQGERQITSLSFIGAIVDIAREQHKKENSNAFEEGGIFPIVMDSPFGALDSDHRERIAKGIYKLADQVIVIVSTSQWRGEVESQMAHVIGKEYILKYNDPRKNKERPYEYTEIVEVK
jgi:DNA sulfur modification protein DndD